MQGYRVNKHIGSVRFINYYHETVVQNYNNPDAGNSNDFLALFTRLKINRALDVFACLLHKATYIRYGDLDDKNKEVCRLFWHVWAQKALDYKAQQIEPGAMLRRKLLKAAVHEERIQGIMNVLGPQIAEARGTFATRSVGAVNRLAVGLHMRNAPPLPAIIPSAVGGGFTYNPTTPAAANLFGNMN